LLSVSNRYSVSRFASNASASRLTSFARPSLAFERGARALHRAVDVSSGRVWNPRDHVGGRRVANFQQPAVSGLDLPAVDEIAVDLDFDGA
jgi:hypothetical protein